MNKQWLKAELEVNYTKSTQMYTESLEDRIQVLENLILEG